MQIYRIVRKYASTERYAVWLPPPVRVGIRGRAHVLAGYYGTCAALLGHIVSKSYCGVGPRSVGSVAGERTGTNGLEAASAAAVVGAAAADSQLAVD